MIRFEIHAERIEVANADAANALRRALGKAVLKEREACAQIAERCMQENVAFLIRGRTAKEVE